MDPSLSVLELMKVELDKFQILKTEMEKVVSERDSLTKEAEELRLKKVKYKTRVRELEEMMFSSSAAETPPIPFSYKCRRIADDSVSGKQEVAGGGYNSGIAKSERDNQPRNLQLLSSAHLMAPVIDNISKILKKENLKKFEQSCFGHLMGIKKLKIQGQLVLQLLFHLDMSASSKKKLVFRINHSNIEFGPREFSLITGLRLGTLEATTVRSSFSSIRKNLFVGHSGIMLKDIEQHFLDDSCDDKDRDEMMYKWAMLYFLHGILLARFNLRIDEKYLPLIEDMAEFNAFPWGRVAYEFLASSMLLARGRLDDSKFTGMESRVCIEGFTLALQVWAYEMMPSLAGYCALRASNLNGPIPRILHWSTPHKRVYAKDLKQFFTPGDEAHLVLHSIQASRWELEALKTGTIPQPKKGKSFIGKDQVSRAAAHDDNDDDDEAAVAAASNSHCKDSDDEFLSDIYMELVARVQHKTSRK